MGYYQCPRCDSTDVYEGTEVVASNKPGNSVSMATEDFMVTQHQAGSTNIHQVQVTKCQQCGEVLSPKDYKLTAAEQAELERELAEAAAKKARRKKILIKIVVTIMILASLITGGFFGVDMVMDYIDVQKRSKVTTLEQYIEYQPPLHKLFYSGEDLHDISGGTLYISGHGFPNLNDLSGLKNCLSLEHLEIAEIDLSNNQLKNIAGLPNIRTITLRDVDLSNNQLMHIVGLPNLVNIKISYGCTGLSTTDLIKYAEARAKIIDPRGDYSGLTLGFDLTDSNFTDDEKDELRSTINTTNRSAVITR